MTCLCERKSGNGAASCQHQRMQTRGDSGMAPVGTSRAHRSTRHEIARAASAASTSTRVLVGRVRLEAPCYAGVSRPAVQAGCTRASALDTASLRLESTGARARGVGARQFESASSSSSRRSAVRVHARQFEAASSSSSRRSAVRVRVKQFESMLGSSRPRQAVRDRVRQFESAQWFARRARSARAGFCSLRRGGDSNPRCGCPHT
jgi:hypothetical protein